MTYVSFFRAFKLGLLSIPKQESTTHSSSTTTAHMESRSDSLEQETTEYPYFHSSNTTKYFPVVVAIICSILSLILVFVGIWVFVNSNQVITDSNSTNTNSTDMETPPGKYVGVLSFSVGFLMLIFSLILGIWVHTKTKNKVTYM